MRVLNAATESVPKLVLFGWIIANSDSESSASVGSYISLGLVVINILATCDLVMAEIIPELARVEPPAVWGAPASPTLALKLFIDRLVSADEITPEDVVREWREAFGGDDDEQVLEAQLCVLLADIVCLEHRERLFRAAVVVASAVITLADAVSDVNVIALYWGSAIGTILLIHFVVAMVSLLYLSLVVQQ